MKTIVNIIAVVSIMGFCFALGFSVKRGYRNTPITQKAPVCTPDTFSVNDFVFELHLQGIKHSDIVLRQACLESGYFTSSIWKDCNNPFGFYYNGEYIAFADWKASIVYYKTWQDKWYKGGDYMLFLDKIGYAEDPEYQKKLKRINLQNIR